MCRKTGRMSIMKIFNVELTLFIYFCIILIHDNIRWAEPVMQIFCRGFRSQVTGILHSYPEVSILKMAEESCAQNYADLRCTLQVQ